MSQTVEKRIITSSGLILIWFRGNLLTFKKLKKKHYFLLKYWLATLLYLNRFQKHEITK